MAKIAVVGSINADLVVEADRRPEAGETLPGRSFTVIPGGKGANQAVAIARLGGEVELFGCIGQDSNGLRMRENLMNNGVKTGNIKTEEDESTGIAVIVVADHDNSIIVVPGANAAVSPDYIETVREHLLQAELVLMQHEIPMETIRPVTELCHARGIPVILNPAPALQLEQPLIEKLAFLIPNEHEAEIIFGPDKELDVLLSLYPHKLIVTLGEEGAAYCNGKQIVRIPAIKARVVDTTGAGDTFIGAFAFAVSRKKNLDEAILFAQYAAGLSIEKFGAQAGMPTLAAVKKRMKRDGCKSSIWQD